MTTTCRTCVTPLGYINCPTGGWWAHEKHPADNHDAVPAAWVDNDPLMETIAETVWAHCRTEGTSLVVDDPRNIAATAAAVARHFAAAVSVPPPADQTALRDRIAAALYERERPPRDPAWVDAYAMDREVFEAMADAVLAVLPEPTDRGAEALAAIRPQTLTALASHIDARSVAILRPDSQTYAEWQTMAALLRRVAAEEQAAETHSCRSCAGVDPDTCLMNPDRPKRPPMDPVHILGIDAAPEQPAVGEQPETQEASNLPCSYWTLTRTEHTPHRWEPQPGMDPVRCPGYSRTPE